MNKYSILVNSCDKYEEAWDPFFDLLKCNWSTLSCKLYLNTESKSYKYKDGSVDTINSTEHSWGKRMANALRKIDTPYVIVFLEDFFLQKKVNEKEIDKCVEALEKDKTIAAFYFNKITGYNNVSIEYPDYYEMNITNENKGMYYCNCQVAIWRRETLIRMVEKSDNPWDFEIQGYKNITEIDKDIRLFCSRYARYDHIGDKDIFSYLVDRSTGYGIWRGKWLWNNKRLFKENSIECDFSTLPVMYHFQFVLISLLEILKKPIRRLKIINKEE